MKVLIVAEGKHESGGALKTLVGRVAGKCLECDFDRVQRHDIHAHHGTGQGYYKKAIRWMLEAQKRGYEAIILLVDHDHQPRRRQELNQAQEDTSLARIARAVGVAVETFDAWMLADERALSDVLGTQVPRQQDPETICDPKAVCAELHDSSENQMSLTEMYAALAAIINIDTLEQRCPSGFAPFSCRMRLL
jgi:hypothetical protein